MQLSALSDINQSKDPAHLLHKYNGVGLVSVVSIISHWVYF